MKYQPLQKPSSQVADVQAESVLQIQESHNNGLMHRHNRSFCRSSDLVKAECLLISFCFLEESQLTLSVKKIVK